MSEPLKTPLYDAHVEAGGRMVEFAGYMMPVQYTTGVIAESKAVRDGAGMFDVSHMARLDLHGDRVIEYLEWVTTNDVSKLKDGHGQYSLLPNARGGLVDDIIVYRIDSHNAKMVVNASNHAKDVSHMQSQNRFDVQVKDITDGTAMIAVQGPHATDLVVNISDKPFELSAVRAFSVVDVRVGGVHCFAARSGYTGEDGYELVCPAHDAVRLWHALQKAGVVPCGLGARDTLRVEAGLPLYGHELTDDLSPIAAGLGWVISKTKEFLGSGPIKEARKTGTPTKLQGVLLEGKRLPLPGMTVKVDGRAVGSVSSGVYSPLLEKGIAFAFIDATIPQETDCTVDIRGKDEPARIVNKRFFKRI